MAEWEEMEEVGPIDGLIESCFYACHRSAPWTQLQVKGPDDKAMLRTIKAPPALAEIEAWCRAHQVAPELRPVVVRGVLVIAEQMP